MIWPFELQSLNTIVGGTEKCPLVRHVEYMRETVLSPETVLHVKEPLTGGTRVTVVASVSQWSCNRIQRKYPEQHVNCYCATLSSAEHAFSICMESRRTWSGTQEPCRQVELPRIVPGRWLNLSTSSTSTLPESCSCHTHSCSHLGMCTARQSTLLAQSPNIRCNTSSNAIAPAVQHRPPLLRVSSAQSHNTTTAAKAPCLHPFPPHKAHTLSPACVRRQRGHLSWPAPAPRGRNGPQRLAVDCQAPQPCLTAVRH